MRISRTLFVPISILMNTKVRHVHPSIDYRQMQFSPDPDFDLDVTDDLKPLETVREIVQ